MRTYAFFAITDRFTYDILFEHVYGFSFHACTGNWYYISSYIGLYDRIHLYWDTVYVGLCTIARTWLMYNPMSTFLQRLIANLALQYMWHRLLKMPMGFMKLEQLVQTKSQRSIFLASLNSRLLFARDYGASVGGANEDVLQDAAAGVVIDFSTRKRTAAGKLNLKNREIEHFRGRKFWAIKRRVEEFGERVRQWPFTWLARENIFRGLR